MNKFLILILVLAIFSVPVFAWATPAQTTIDPNTKFDGHFYTVDGWKSVGGYSSIDTANHRLQFEGSDGVNAYVYADLEDAAIKGDFELRFETYIYSSNYNPNAIIAGHSDTVGKYGAWNNGIYVYVSRHDRDGARFGLGHRINSIERTRITTFQWRFNTWYYLTLKREGTTASLYVYSDPARTNLLGSVSLDSTTTAKLRYIYAFTGGWAGYGSEVIRGYVDNYKVDVLPPIRAEINIDPNVINLKSEGKWITAYIELPEHDVRDIDVGTLKLEGIRAEEKPTEIGDYDSDGIADLMVKFDRAKVQALLTPGEVSLKVTGRLKDGRKFEGSNTIRVIGPPRAREGR